MSPLAAQVRGRHQRLPQWSRGGLVVAGISCWGGVLPACLSLSVPPHLSHLAWEVWAPFSLWHWWFSGFLHPSLHIQETCGPCLQALGLLCPCSPQGWLPSFQPAGHEALQAHRGTTDLFSEVFGCPPLSWWVAKLLSPNPNVRLAEKLLSGAASAVKHFFPCGCLCFLPDLT